jgi:hypothetical protein
MPTQLEEGTDQRPYRLALFVELKHSASPPIFAGVFGNELASVVAGFRIACTIIGDLHHRQGALSQRAAFGEEFDGDTTHDEQTQSLRSASIFGILPDS